MEPARKELARIGQRTRQLPMPEDMRDHVQSLIDDLTSLHGTLEAPTPVPVTTRQQTTQTTHDRMHRSGTDRSDEENED